MGYPIPTLKCQNDLCALFVPLTGRQCQHGKLEPILNCSTRLLAEERQEKSGGLNKIFTQKAMDILLVQDAIQIAQYLAWQTEVGDSLAQDRINEIHKGKYGSTEGAWVQVSKAMDRIQELLGKHI